MVQDENSYIDNIDLNRYQSDTNKNVAIEQEFDDLNDELQLLQFLDLTHTHDNDGP